MKQRDKQIFIIVCIFFILFCYFKDGLFEKPYEYKLSGGQINSTFPITFYHDSYVDFRVSPPVLRVFSLNPCVRDSNYLLVKVHYEGVVEPTVLQLKGDALEGTCPSFLDSAKSCLYSPYSFVGQLSVHGGIEKVVVDLKDRQVRLNTKVMERKLESGLTLCVQPVYYYTQWQNIILYIESWIAQGASRFIVFYHSGTKETRRVLEHYQNLGVIELRSWPYFGSLRPELANKYPNIDDSVFIFSYFLAMNICILDMKTSLGTIADFDEVMVAKEGSVLEYALREMTGTDVGSLQFETRYVTLSPSIYTSNFTGVSNPIFIDRWQHPKYIFNVSSIEVAQVHYIRSFLEPKTTKIATGGTLHFRYGIEKYKERIKRPLKFFPDNTNEKLHIQRMEDTATRLFNGSFPNFDEEILLKMKSCGTVIKNTNSCLSKSGLCKKEMDALYDWVYDKSDGIFLS